MPESLFAPVTINRLVLPNRFVRSATHEGLCGEDGLYTPALTEKLAELARGGIGLIISGHAFVSPGGRAGRNQAAAGRDECVVPWEHALEQIHAAGGRIALQLAHAGGLAADAETAAGPSPFAAGTKRPPCRELTLSSIAELVDLFTSAAVRAHEAGFDAVEIHAAHGYLLSQFLSPVYNKRTDRYGGELANRARLLYEIVSSIRNAVGGDFPILVKINSDDFADGGFTAAECGRTSGTRRGRDRTLRRHPRLPSRLRQPPKRRRTSLLSRNRPQNPQPDRHSGHSRRRLHPV